MEKAKTLVLSSNCVNQIVQTFGLNNIMDTLIDYTTAAIKKYNSDLVEVPTRFGFNYETRNPGLIEMMPAHVKEKEVAIKVVGYHPKNPQLYNLPTILSTISSYCTATGHLKGVADGVLLTSLRTGAASAIVTKILAKSDSSTLGLIGCGAQAVTQLHAISRVAPIQKVLIYDIDTNTIDSFVERSAMLGIEVVIIRSSIQEIISTSDIVCTATSIDINEGPLFDNIKPLPHLHINAVGSDFPGKTELPLSLLKNSIVCPDFLEQAKKEGECQQLEDSEIGPDIISLVKNSNNYIGNQLKTTVFDSTGWALEDQIVVNLFFELAKKYNLGEEIALENISEDAKSPYNFMLNSISI